MTRRSGKRVSDAQHAAIAIAVVPELTGNIRGRKGIISIVLHSLEGVA